MENEIEEYKEKIKNIVIDFFNCQEEEIDLKKKEIKIYYGSLISNNFLSIEDKVKITTVYINTFYYFLLDFAIDFLVLSIKNIYRKEINEELLINNSYFFYRFLGNKEKIKNIFIRYQFLAEINFNLSFSLIDKIDSDVKDKYIKDYGEIIYNHHEKMVNFFGIDDNINFYVTNLKNIIEDDYLINFIDQKDVSFFLYNEKKEIIFSDFFVLFFTTFFNFKIENEPLNLKTDDIEKIKNELLQRIKVIF